MTAFLWTVIVWNVIGLWADMRGARKHVEKGDGWALVFSGALHAGFISWALFLLP